MLGKACYGTYGSRAICHAVNSKAKSKIVAKISDTETFSWLARIGYATRGSVFLIIGGLALLAAGDSAERPQGMRDAMQTVFDQPLGGFMLWAIVLGLACFAGWRFLQSVFDADALGNGLFGLMRRTSFAVAGMFYLALATATARITIQERTATEDQSARDWTHWAMTKPLGRDLIAVIAAVLVGIAIALMVQVVRAPYRHEFDRERMPLVWVVALGSVGIMTRALVFLAMGIFLGIADYDYNSTEVIGVSGVLRTLQEQSYGRGMLAVAGLGLVAFGAFELIEAYARRVRPPKPVGARRRLKHR
jgi:Domain of Unknown Function (DUF1206)